MRVRSGEVLIVLGAIAVLSTVAALPKYRTEVVRSSGAGGTGASQEGSGAEESSERGTGVTVGPGVRRDPGAPGAAQQAGSNLACAAGRNGGSTDTGVSGTSIKLGATVVDSGIGAAFLSDVRYGMLAVLNEVNASGGICGRRLDLLLKDDGWEADRGFQFIQNLVEGEKVFALAVVPSSEGLRIASTRGYLRAQRVPVVGADGMLISQYTDPVIWPVAASTITAMHVMTKNASDRGRKSFAIVYDSNYRFGVEGAFAFNQSVRRITGKDVPGYVNPLSGAQRCEQRFCGIKAGQPSYGTEIQVVNSACSREPHCDYIVYLLEPQTAQTWMDGGGLGAGFIGGTEIDVGGPQPLFNRSFGVNCAQRCHGAWVWASFAPPIEPFVNTATVSKYVGDIKRTNAQADASNSFVEGGYLGMKLLVEGLRKAGPGLTRKGLIDALDGMRLDAGLSRPLQFRQGNHFANQCMMGFSIQARPSFAGWRQETDWICDPFPGQDIPAES